MIWETYKERDIDCEVLSMADETSMDYIERRLARSVAGSPFTQTSSCAAPNARKSTRKTKQTTAAATTDDEYARYCAEDIVNSHRYRSRPIGWWKINAHRYPRLSLMAVDMLTIVTGRRPSGVTVGTTRLVTEASPHNVVLLSCNISPTSNSLLCLFSLTINSIWPSQPLRRL